MYLGELGMAVPVLLGHFYFFLASLLALKSWEGVLNGAKINEGTVETYRCSRKTVLGSLAGAESCYMATAVS